MKDYIVQRIDPKEARPWILKKHYAHRLPSILYAFGLYEKKNIVGVMTYGIPANKNLCEGICGVKYKDLVLEFTRLCTDNKRNQGSKLIGGSFNLLPKPKILVSYADTTMGHIGYIYQSTNWIYTGCPQNHSRNIYIDGIKSHSRTHICGEISSLDKLKAKYGERLNIGDYEKKHRYVYFLGTKKQKKEMLKALKYPILPSPKGDSKRYDASAHIEKQISML